MNDQFHVPKRRVAARAQLLGTDERHWQLFLSDMAETHAGPERPSDLVNRKSRFVGVLDAEEGFIIVSTSHICAFTVDVEGEFSADALSTEDLAAAAATMLNVEVLLENGAEVTGSLVYLQPEGQRRLQDFLSHAPEFISLRDGRHAHIVNTSRIVRIRATQPEEGDAAAPEDDLFAPGSSSDGE